MQNSPKTYAFLPPDIEPNLRQVLMRMMNDIADAKRIAATPSEAPATPALRPSADLTLVPINHPNLRVVGNLRGSLGSDPLVGNVYSTVSQALNSCVGNTVSNQFVILIMPGTYTEAITCKDYVHIIGVGAREDVIINAATFTGAINTVAKVSIVIADTSGSANLPINCNSCIEEYPNDVYLNSTAGDAWFHSGGGIAHTDYVLEHERTFGYNVYNNYHSDDILMKPDFSSLPAGVTINTAVLNYHQVIGSVTAGGITLALKFATSAYTPATVTWNTMPTSGATAISRVVYNGTYDRTDALVAADIQAMIAGTYTGFTLHSASYNSCKIYTTASATPPTLSVTYGSSAILTLGAGQRISDCVLNSTYTKLSAGGLASIIEDSTAQVIQNDSSGNTLYVRNCSISTATNGGHIRNTGAGTTVSMTNSFDGSGNYHLLRSAGTLITAGDNYTTSSGTLTPRGNADMLDGLHATSFEPALTAGTSLQYYRGDKTWQTLNSLAVPELTNLYYTDTRAKDAAHFINPVITTGASYSITTADRVLIYNRATAGTVNLPAATGSGVWYDIKNINTGNVTVQCNGAETLDGSNTQTLYQWDGIRIVDYAAGVWIVV